MPIEIRVPQMGESVTEGVIAQWLKSEGDSVSADEPVVEVETDKITVEVPAPSAGVLRKQSAGEGDTVSVGDIIGEIEEGAGQDKQSAGNGQGQGQATAAGEPQQPQQPQQQQQQAREEPQTSRGNGKPALMPAAAAEAKRRGIDPSSIEGTGRGGRVLKEDVIRAASGAQPQQARQQSPRTETRPSGPSGPQVERPISEREVRKAMTPLRKRVAQRLVESQNTAAILTTFNEIDMSGVMELRKRWKEPFLEQHGVKLGFMSFFVKAAVDALKAFPAVNSEIDGDDIIYKHYYDIGVAVGGGKGLVVPVIREADRLSAADIEKQIGDFAKRAKDNKLTLEDLTGGTFTISNGGVYGSMMSTPILNPPQTGILGLHNIVQRPVAVDGEVKIRPVMYIALSYDHRVIDGREAVQFLVRIKNLLEDPERLFLGV